MFSLVIHVEEILEDIENMGYITVKPRGTHTPSFYKLDGGVVLSVLTKIGHLLQNPHDPHGVSINSSLEINIYVPQNIRNQHGKMLTSDTSISKSIIDDDVL